MEKIINLENEKKFIKNKEHLSKEDYERIAEIEIEIREIKKSGKDINVPAKWISVGERLPEDGQVCLVTTKGMLGDTYCEIETFANNFYNVDEFDFYDKKNVSGFYIYNSEIGYYEDADVIAWMPLPKAYTESEVE